MKKLTAILLAFCLLLCLCAGCADRSGSSGGLREDSSSSRKENNDPSTPSEMEGSNSPSSPSKAEGIDGPSMPSEAEENDDPSASSVVEENTVSQPNEDPETQDEKLAQLYDTYLEPLDHHFTVDEWDWPDRAPSNWLDLFEKLYYHENGHLPYEDYGVDWPVEEMTATVNRYFDGVTRQMVIDSNFRATYDATTDTLHYEGGRGGGAPDPLRVTDWKEDGTLLTLYYEAYDRDTGVPYDPSRALTVELMEDGSFRYRSCYQIP